MRQRLERAGLVVAPETTTVAHDFMGVPGIVYRTDRAEIQVFLYPDPAAREEVTSRLDTVRVTPRDRRKVWREPVSLVTSGNLAAIILSLNDRTAERIGLALGAGLPAEAPSRRPPR